MAVAHTQTAEIQRVLDKYLEARVVDFLEDLSKTAAYKWNKSFRDTVNRLMDRYGMKRPAPPGVRPA